MHIVWEVNRDSGEKEFIAVFKDRRLAEQFAVELVEREHTTYEIVYMEPSEGR